MVVVKSIGSVILFVTAFYYSWARQKQEIRKERIMSELCTMFSYIQKNIECYTMPLGEIYRGYTGPELEHYGFYNNWHKGELMAAVNTLELLPESAKKALYKYALHAGKGYKDSELELCRDVKNRLEEVLLQQQKEIKEKNKLYRTLPFLLVLSVVLLFM